MGPHAQDCAAAEKLPRPHSCQALLALRKGRFWYLCTQGPLHQGPGVCVEEGKAVTVSPLPILEQLQ